MVGYAVYKKGSPDRVGVITYDHSPDRQILDSLIEHLGEAYGAEVTVRLMNQAELDSYLSSAFHAKSAKPPIGTT
jgi:UDP-glucose 6-dehydrogenase